jgi:hypothetical protein
MTMWDRNPYYSPEKFDLTPVDEIEYSDGCYNFDTRVVWKHSSGKLYTARDAGCSCPSPFEDYRSLEDLDELTDLACLEREVKEDHNRSSVSTASEAQSFLRKVREALEAG